MRKELILYNTHMKPLIPESKTSLQTGLTDGQALHKPSNQIPSSHQETTAEMVIREFFSFFNIINYILAGLIILTGSYRNLLFMVIVLSNTFIGLFQKIRSRRVLNKLALIHQQTFPVLRSGVWQTLPVDQIVQGDILRLSSGAQIPCDCVVRQGECQVNESMLTGESDPIDRALDGPLYGGCFVVSGQVLAQAVEVGASQYMAGILADARRSKEQPSQLRDLLNNLIKFCTWMLIPAGALLFVKLFYFSDLSLNTSILNTCASMIGMIPEGLMILTSTALAAASVKMARQAVLIHDLYSVEGLARVDTLCLDKTGTITSGMMNVTRFVPLDGQSESTMKQNLSDLFGSLEDDNVTAQALRRSLADIHPSRKAEKKYPFSSITKCSGARFGDETLLFGAYTFLMAHPDEKVLAQIEGYAAKGLRVLALAKTGVIDKLEPGDYTLCGLVLIEDEIRPDAPRILSYFKEQGVDIKVISGDMAQTVEAIARRAGVNGDAIDMQHVAPDEIDEAVRSHSIFGRVTPEQKKLMVAALQKQGHTVGMTGDGVNDVMALKQADCSIAMGSGAQAALAVSSLVLLQDQFSILPGIVMEGRRVINNIQRTASLFLVKTVFSFVLTLMTVAWMRSYPFIPIQLTLVSSFGTGIPAFILTFENDTSRLKGNFMVSVLSRAIPGALAVCLGVAMLYVVFETGIVYLPVNVFQTICTILAAINAMCVLYWICRPLSLVRLLVLIGCAAGFVIVILVVPQIFSLVHLNMLQFVTALCVAGLQVGGFLLLQKVNWRKLLSGALLKSLR